MQRIPNFPSRQPPAFPGVLAVALFLSSYAQGLAAEPVGRPPELRGIFGATHRYDEFLEPSTQALVFVVMDEHCPVVRQYASRLIQLHEDYNSTPRDRAGAPIRQMPDGSWSRYNYEGDRVVLIGVYVSPGMSIKRMAEHAVNTMLPFRVLLDSEHELVRQFGLTRLSEAVVLDRDLKVRYQGAIDDQFFQGGSKPAATRHYLRDAIDAVLAGSDPPRSSTPAVGCKITAPAPPKSESPYTYHQHIKPLFQARCERCHREGEVGPMPLTTYPQVSEYAEMIREVVLDERMPPWPAALPPDSHRQFADDDRLTEDERWLIADWCSSGRVEGDRSLAPAEIQWPAQQWRIGEPDLIFEMKQPMKVPANGLLDYVYYPVKVSLPEDKWISAIETVPGNPRVVHHIQVHEYRGRIFDKSLSPLEQFRHYGLSIEGGKLMGAYTPGNQDNARNYNQPPAGVTADQWPSMGMKLSAGSNLIFELHYTPVGEELMDQSRVAIKFADAPPERELKTHFFFRKRGDFLIPANAQNHSMQQIYAFHAPVIIYQMRPHFHVRGKSYRLELVDSEQVSIQDLHDFSQHNKPRGETIFTIPVWDFNWQLTYKLKEPLVVPAGKVLLATGYWDNTQHNPRNPDPNEDVRWGQQTVHEMFNTMFVYEELQQDDPRLAAAPTTAESRHSP